MTVHPDVERVLGASRVAYTVHRHADQPTPIRGPADLAAALQLPPRRIAKTLLVEPSQGGAAVRVVLRALDRVDLQRLAAALGVPRLRLAPAERLAAEVGHPPGGVSPLGADSTRTAVAAPVVVDELLLGEPTILVGAGEVGVEIELDPHDLVRLTGATVLDLSAASTAERSASHV